MRVPILSLITRELHIQVKNGFGGLDLGLRCDLSSLTILGAAASFGTCGNRAI